MDKLKDQWERLTGKSQYHHNLLGESLPDLLRKATAKTLVTPDETINQQVVDTIQQEVASGKDTKEIVTLLKKRLRTDNPQKQWLAVLLLNKVMPECSNILGMHQEELLQEVAKVMAKPAKPETEAGKAARHAAKELLRKFGRAGTSAFRAAHQEVYGRHMPPAPGIPVGAIPYGYSAADYGGHGGLPGDGGAGSVERQSLAEEIQLLIDKARSNTELLSDMLVNTSGAPRDEFEQELINDLLSEVVELRGLFDAYLEQLQVHSSPDMEVLMCQALEACDLLDGCITLQKDVSSNQELPATGSGSAAPTTAGASTAAAGGAVAVTTPAAAPAVPKKNDDLIALDDLADGLMQTTISAPAVDPFAASTVATPPQQSEPTPAAAKPPMKSAFENMFAAAGASAGTTYNALQAAAPGTANAQPAASQIPTPGYASAPTQHQQQPQPQYPPTVGYGTYGNSASAYGSPGQPQFYGAPQYAPPPQYPPTPGMPYGAGYAPSPYGMPQGQAPPGMYSAGPTGAGAPAASSNPFAARGSDGGGVYGMAATGGLGSALPTTTSSNNPFAVATPAQANAQQTSLDQEWNMFFADRAGAGQGVAGAATGHNPQQINADFDALVAKPTAAR